MFVSFWPAGSETLNLSSDYLGFLASSGFSSVGPCFLVFFGFAPFADLGALAALFRVMAIF